MKVWECFVIAVGVVIAAAMIGRIASYLQERDMDWVLGVILAVIVLTGYIWFVTNYW